MCLRSEKYVIEGSKYAHWIGVYLSFHLNWILGPFVHGRLQNLQTSKVTFAHVITPLSLGCNGQTFFLCMLNSPYRRAQLMNQSLVFLSFLSPTSYLFVVNLDIKKV